jgi:hypothetical protein
VKDLGGRCRRLTKDKVMSQTCFSRSQIYRWMEGQLERKKRVRKVLPEKTVENAA